jgi:hypothetical protein
MRRRAALSALSAKLTNSNGPPETAVAFDFGKSRTVTRWPEPRRPSDRFGMCSAIIRRTRAVALNQPSLRTPWKRP